jgi:hypothetical protein
VAAAPDLSDEQNRRLPRAAVCQEGTEVRIGRDNDPALRGGHGHDLMIWRTRRLKITHMDRIMASIAQQLSDPG